MWRSAVQKFSSGGSGFDPSFSETEKVRVVCIDSKHSKHTSTLIINRKTKCMLAECMPTKCMLAELLSKHPDREFSEPVF